MPFHIVKDGKQRGPYSQMQVTELLRSGELTPADLAWEPGMAAWLPLAQVPAFEGDSATPAAPEPSPIQRLKDWKQR